MTHSPQGTDAPGLTTAYTSAPLPDATIHARTDSYFNRTREIVSHFGDCQVTYAFFIRRPVISAPGLMLEWLKNVMAERNSPYSVDLVHPEGDWVGAGEPLVYITGSFTHLADLETLLLQKLGSPCVAAHRAYQIAISLPQTRFLAMDARHCAGFEMQELMAYAASVGGRTAQRDGAIGFVGTANDAVAPFFGTQDGAGTMPHALIGYAGSTVRAAEMFHEMYPDATLVVLVDYFGQEITDALAVCRRFPQLAAEGRLAMRLDTHGGRFLEGLNPQLSYAVLDRHAPESLRRYRSDSELRYLIGTGVSAAAVWRMRDALDEAGFPQVKIIASSGFGVTKCACMADARAPIDIVGTGSFIPDRWNETYATADIVSYNGVERVKIGREFLLPSAQKTQKGKEE
ncbi:Nicotinate phosphoribosyltransferase [Acetobacter malorum]|nr:nicotinate phosphoribosyltransferase [Acetobacter malorum]OAG75885.1 Nicotinate phosphoribosyltransferase [Acetobacter malorum]